MKKTYKKPMVRIKKQDIFSEKKNQVRYCASENMLLREIAGECLLIPVGEMTIKIHGMIALSESGLLLWKKLKNASTEEELVEEVLREYDIDRQTATDDVREFIGSMKEIGIVFETDGE